ncbi:MAG TPA: glycosyltransferase family 1 protein, partial [Dehalococcoidia bacterium]|nr:glycosyltransferase family 1 protein [Dehalococcoidia bacterium]
ALVRQSPATDRIRLIGRVAEEDKPALYAGADAFVFPSRYEGFGLTVLEALACGTPVVCSNAASLPEVAGDAALLVAPGDLGGLSAAIDRVLSDPLLRADLRSRGPRQAARFSWRRTAEATLSAYREAAAGD